MIDFGWVPANSTLYIPFASYGADGQSLTLTGLAVTDVECFKNGSTTQRTSDNGIALLDTDGIDFDGITGLHGFSIDLSDNSDSGFWSVGGQYWIVIASVTINSQTVTLIAATFRIRPAEAQTGYPKVDMDYWQGSQPNPVDSGRVVAVVGDVQAGAIGDSGFASDAFDKIRGGDGDTLETLSDQLDAKASQASVDDLPTNSELNSALSPLATAAELAKVPKSDGTATWNATALASIQTEANDAIVENHLDHLFATTYDPSSKPGAADALFNELVENDGGVARFTENALEQAPSGGGGGGGDCPTVEEIVAGLSGRTIVVQSPLDGTRVTLYAEAEYEAGTQRLVITNATGAGWPNGATWNSVKFVARTGGTTAEYGTGAWVVESGAGAQVAITFTSEEMAELQSASDENNVCAVWAYKSGDETSRFPLLAEGKLRMVDVPWA